MRRSPANRLSTSAVSHYNLEFYPDFATDTPRARLYPIRDGQILQKNYPIVRKNQLYSSQLGESTA